MKSTKYIVEITNQKKGRYLYVVRNPVAGSWNFPRQFIEKCFGVFDQSSWAIYLTWYRPLLFFWEFSSIIPFMVWL